MLRTASRRANPERGHDADPTARDGRRPFVQLGANHCPLKSSPDASPRGMAWCDASILEAPGANRSSREAVTGSFDTSVMYALNGHVDADDGEHIYLCAAKSHRGDLARTRLHADAHSPLALAGTIWRARSHTARMPTARRSTPT